MCQAIDELIEDGRMEGLREGKSAGVDLGIALAKNVLELNAAGMPVSQIAET